MQRIGVFVCHCGTNIAGTVDVKAVADAIRHEPGVVFSTDYPYMCSQAGQDIIKQAIAEQKLTAMMVTHNMKDAIAMGNRLIMMNAGRIVVDVRGEEKKKLTREDLMQLFEKAAGQEIENDRMLLS